MADELGGTIIIKQVDQSRHKKKEEGADTWARTTEQKEEDTKTGAGKNLENVRERERERGSDDR